MTRIALQDHSTSPQAIGPAEQEARVQLAALYQEFGRMGWSKVIFNHITARVPGSEHFLINPFGLLYEEVTASNLIKVDLEGQVIGESPWPVNEAGFIIHSAVHAARPDVACVIHHHAPAVTAVASLTCGLLPYTLEGVQFHGRVAYYDYTGISEDREECARIAQALGGCKVLMMRNHGVLVTGGSIAESLYLAVNLDLACRTQLQLMQSGGKASVIPVDVALHTVDQVSDKPAKYDPMLAAVMRRLDRLSPGYRD